MNLLFVLAKVLKKIQLAAIKNSQISKTSKVCSGSYILNSKIDKYSYVGNFSTVNNTDIGKFCSIADNCVIGGASHPINWVSTSPVFHDGKNILKRNFSTHSFITTKQTIIGNDVWIGNHTLVKSGIKISDGAIIGMGSVVTKDIGPYEIWAGNPAKLLRKRFSDEIIGDLITTQWWDYDDKELGKIAVYFNQTQDFILNHMKGNSE